MIALVGNRYKNARFIHTDESCDLVAIVCDKSLYFARYYLIFQEKSSHPLSEGGESFFPCYAVISLTMRCTRAPSARPFVSLAASGITRLNSLPFSEIKRATSERRSSSLIWEACK